jgi:hypothetical protein
MALRIRLFLARRVPEPADRSAKEEHQLEECRAEWRRRHPPRS